MTTPITKSAFYILSIGGILSVEIKDHNLASGAACVGNEPHFNDADQTRVWVMRKLDNDDNTWEIFSNSKELVEHRMLTMMPPGADNNYQIVSARQDKELPDSQRWALLEVKPQDGQVLSYVIKNKQFPCVLDLSGGTNQNGTPLIGWQATNGWNQQWMFIPVN